MSVEITRSVSVCWLRNIRLPSTRCQFALSKHYRQVRACFWPKSPVVSRHQLDSNSQHLQHLCAGRQELWPTGPHPGVKKLTLALQKCTWLVRWSASRSASLDFFSRAICSSSLSWASFSCFRSFIWLSLAATDLCNSAISLLQSCIERDYFSVQIRHAKECVTIPFWTGIPSITQWTS